MLIQPTTSLPVIARGAAPSLQAREEVETYLRYQTPAHGVVLDVKKCRELLGAGPVSDNQARVLKSLHYEANVFNKFDEQKAFEAVLQHPELSEPQSLALCSLARAADQKEQNTQANFQAVLQQELTDVQADGIGMLLRTFNRGEVDKQQAFQAILAQPQLTKTQVGCFHELLDNGRKDHSWFHTGNNLDEGKAMLALIQHPEIGPEKAQELDLIAFQAQHRPQQNNTALYLAMLDT